MKNRSIGVSLLRIFACFCVFMVHFGQRTMLTGIVRAITDKGQHGVRLFFVLSGYLACLSWYEHNRKNSISKKSVIEYYKRRAIRLLPLYYFCIAYYFITETFFWNNIPPDPLGLYWLRYIFCLNGLIPGDVYFWSNLGITWTIPVFVYFYLLFPLIAKYFNTFTKAFILLIITTGLSIVRFHYLGDYLVVLKHFAIFIIGVLAYHAIKEHREKPFLLICLGLVVLSVFHITINLFIYGAISGILLLFLYNIRTDNDKIQKVVNTLDSYTYTVYLSQGIVYCGFIDKLGMSPKRNALVAVVGTIIISVLIKKLIEQPIQSVLNARLNRKHTDP